MSDLIADYGRLTTKPSREDDAHRSADSGHPLSSNAFDRPSVGGRPDNGPLSLPWPPGVGRRVVRLPVCSGAGYLVTITGMKRMPVTIWVAARTCLVTAGL